MLNLSRNGQAVYMLYGSKNYGNGSTVLAYVYDNANSQISGSPFTLSEIASTGLYGNTFTPSTTGEYKIQITEDGTERAHASIKITTDDIESVGSNVTSIKSILENATYGNSALNDKLDDIEGSGFTTGSDSLVAIKNYLVNTIQSSIDGISNNVNTAVSIPSKMLRPASGEASIPYKIYVNVYDSNGNMEDPDDQDAGAGTAMVSVAAEDESGNSRDSNVSGLDSSTQGGLNWMTRVSEGRFSCIYTVADTHDIEQLNFSFGYEESGQARIVDRTSIITSQLDIEDAVNEIYSEVTNATYGLSALKTLLDTVDGKIDTVDTVVDSIEAKVDIIDGVVDNNYSLLTNGTYGLSALKDLIDAVQSNVSGQAIDLSEIKGAGFNTSTDSLEAIANRQVEFMGSGFSASTDTLEKIADSIASIDTGTGGYIG